MPNYCWCSVFTGVLSPSPWWEIPSFNLIQCSRMTVSNFLPGVLFFCFSNHSEATGIKTLQVMAYGWNRISLHSISGSGVLEGCWQPCGRKHLAEQGLPSVWFGLPLSTCSHTFQQKWLSSYRVLHFSREELTVGAMSICFILFQNKDDSWGKIPLKTYPIISCHHYANRTRY